VQVFIYLECHCDKDKLIFGGKLSGGRKSSSFFLKGYGKLLNTYINQKLFLLCCHLISEGTFY